MKILLLRSLMLLFSILLALTLARGLPAKLYAEFAVLYGIVTVGGTVFSLGMPQSIAAGIINAKDENEIEEIFKASTLFLVAAILIISLSGAALLLLKHHISGAAKYLTEERVGSVGLGIWAIVFEKVAADHFRGEGRSTLYTLAGGPLSAMVSLVVVWLKLASNITNEASIIASIAASTILSSLTIVTLFSPKLLYAIPYVFERKIANTLLGLISRSGYNWVFESTVWLRAQSDIWIVAAILQPENVRDYSVGFRIGFAALVPLATLSLASSSSYSLLKNSKASVVSCINRIRRQTFLFGSCVIILLWSISARMFPMVLGVSGGNAAEISNILAFGIFLCILLGPGAHLLQINRQEKKPAIAALISLLIHVPVAILFGSVFGVYGVVAGSVLMYIFQNAFIAAIANNSLGIQLLSFRVSART